MLKINTTTFNPQILYIADCYTNEPSIGTKHHHDFLEMSVIYSGSVNYNIDNQIYHLKAGDVLLFNPGIDHFEFSEDGTENTQIHIGFRHFSLEGYPRDTFPFKTSVIRLHENKTKFMETCTQLLAEKYHEKPGYDLMLKALLMHLIIYILRDADPEQLENNGFKLSTEAQEKTKHSSTKSSITWKNITPKTSRYPAYRKQCTSAQLIFPKFSKKKQASHQSTTLSKSAYHARMTY
ncbi:AraC family transcriptional regulator [Listeria riparia FSL S10-1204]|uniref:AraC family transcriptional regulator n=1 Tax=Listeria riparia FSL S10-1204 TaxID=1265816 RepID=W7D520_9LIST|nr:AraC family transcriptional regulator [Listeria riparia FSL S10-1204]